MMKPPRSIFLIITILNLGLSSTSCKSDPYNQAVSTDTITQQRNTLRSASILGPDSLAPFLDMINHLEEIQQLHQSVRELQDSALDISYIFEQQDSSRMLIQVGIMNGVRFQPVYNFVLNKNQQLYYYKTTTDETCLIKYGQRNLEVLKEKEADK